MRLRILGYVGGYDGCSLVRIQKPFKYLNRIPGVLAKVSSSYDLEDIKWADIIILQRQFQGDVLPYVSRAQELGKSVVFEFDDLITDIPPWNKAYDYYKDKAERFTLFMRSCEACTVSTEYLKDVNIQYNPNICVLPNSIDLEDIESKDQDEGNKAKFIHFSLTPYVDAMQSLKDRTKIVWWGSPTHKLDLNIVDKTLALLAQCNKDVAIVMMGYCTPEFVEAMKTYTSQVYVIDSVQTHNFYKALGYVLRSGPTITLSPIVPIPFNFAKSNLKILESMAFKTAPVASNVGSYTQTITNGFNGYLVENTLNQHGIAPDWYDKVQHLINHPGLISSMGENGYKTVTDSYNIANNVNLWLNAYDSICN